MIETLYASGGNEKPVPCLSFRCDAWPDSIHLCQGFDDLTVILETGETVTFMAADFVGTLAKKDTAGIRSINYAIDARESDALQRIDLALNDEKLVYSDYREYLPSDLSAPSRLVETLTVTSYRHEEPQLGFSASFHDLVNPSWPRRRYTQDKFPGTKYA